MTQTAPVADQISAAFSAALELALAAAPGWGNGASAWTGTTPQGEVVASWNRRIGWAFARRARAAADALLPGLLRDLPIAETVEELEEFAVAASGLLAEAAFATDSPCSHGTCPGDACRPPEERASVATAFAETAAAAA